jgi:bacterial/archaeal transporter family-2 protein
VRRGTPLTAPAPPVPGSGPPGASGSTDRSATVLLVLGLALLAGMLIAAQSRVNGGFVVRLGDGTGPAIVTALVSFTVGTGAVALVTLLSPQARRALRPPWPERVRWWFLLGGLGGATLVAVSAFAVPMLGVALLSVGIVAGQTTGGLLVDRLGIGPGGRRPVTVPRLIGALLAVAAVALGGLGTRAGEGSPLLLLLVAFAGFLVAGQVAVNGRLAGAVGDFRVASLASFLGGTTVLAVLAGAIALAGAMPPLTFPPFSVLWLGGIGGAAYITLSAAIVHRLGVLRLTLAVVAGQLLAGVAFDALAPVPGQGLTLAAVVGTVLTFVAVTVAGRGTRR